MATPNSTSASRWAQAIGLFCALAGVGAVGYFSGSRAVAPPAASAGEPSSIRREGQPAQYVTRQDLSALTSEIRAQLRGSTRSQAAPETAEPSCEERPTAGDAVREDDPQPAPDAAQLREYDRTKTLIQVASGTRAWKAEDSRAFRASVDVLPAPLRNELISELLQAINSDRLRPDYDGPPF